MAEIVPLRSLKNKIGGVPLINKLIEGKIIECIDVDALSASDRVRFLELRQLAKTGPASS